MSLNIWEVRRPVAGVLGEECFPILVWWRIVVSQRSGPLMQDFSFYNAPTVLYRWKIWTAGRFSTRTLLLWSHTVVMDSVCGLTLSCWNIHGLPWKWHCLDGKFRFWFIWPQNNLAFYIRLFQMSFDPGKTLEFLDHIHMWFLLFSEL